MVIRSLLILFVTFTLPSSMLYASVPTTGQYQGEYSITMRAAPLGSILGVGVKKVRWTWDFDTDTATLSGTTLSVGFNYLLHDLDDADKSHDTLHFIRNNDSTITLAYALQVYNPSLGNPIANTTTTFRIHKNGAKFLIETIDREIDGNDGIPGTKIYNVFPLTIEPDFVGNIVQVNTDYNQDGIDDQAALALGLNPNKLDTDNDGISDFTELGSDHDNPLDSDGDSIIDALEFGDSALNPQKVTGLLTENKQHLTVETSDQLTIKNVFVGSMYLAVPNPDSSDDFPNLDSSLGQPGITYPWGNLSLDLAVPSNILEQTKISLEFSQPLPKSLLIYALSNQGKYQLLSANDWYQDSTNNVIFNITADSNWVIANSMKSTYQLTIAIAENTLGGINMDERKTASGGSFDSTWLLLLSLCMIGRFYQPLPSRRR